ncbi:ER membrane protein complex subunit 8/9 homolog [Wolffia australiana]
MGGESRYEIKQEAYVKLALHAIKYSTSAIDGILVGRLLDAGSVQIVDAVPLSHSQIGLLPSLELALIQVEEHFGAQGLSIVGYYQANERFDDDELSGSARRIGDHIFRHFPLAALLLLNSKNLEALLKGRGKLPILQLYTRDSSKNWRKAETGTEEMTRLTLKEPSANSILLDYVSTEKWRDIVDFDDHLDDISRDWLNSDLFQ